MEILNDTWEHDGANWTQIDNVHGGMYPARVDAAIEFDASRNRMVAFGGVIANNGVRDDMWEYGAHFQPFGLGCTGSAGVPAMTATTAPLLGGVFSGQVSNLPPSSPLAAALVGTSRTQWTQGSLPMLLGGFGMPNCRIYQSMDVVVMLPVINGVATWNWQVPPLFGLAGAEVHMQCLAYDPPANAAGQTMSNAATIVLGN
jgi:hypothetical protein